MSGIKDVALLAGVSQATASRALSGRGSVSSAARERVKEAAAKLGFVVSHHASSLATGRSRTVGVVLPYVNRWYFSTVLEGITASLIEAGYDLTLYDFQGDRYRATVMDDFLLRKHLDGVITVGLRLSPADVEQLLSIGVPTVSIGGHLDGIPSLLIDDEAVGRLGTEHLISLGHSKIAHIGGQDESSYYFKVSRSRRDGYRAAMSSAGLEQRPVWSVVSDYTVTGAYNDGKSLLADPHNRPTAVVCASDEMAVGVILAARDLGIRVPEELSVIGVDRHPLGEVFGLTTIDQFAGVQGERAARALLAQIDAGPIVAGPIETGQGEMGQGEVGASETGQNDRGVRRVVGGEIVLPIKIVARSSTTAPPRSSS